MRWVGAWVGAGRLVAGSGDVSKRKKRVSANPASRDAGRAVAPFTIITCRAVPEVVVGIGVANVAKGAESKPVRRILCRHFGAGRA